MTGGDTDHPSDSAYERDLRAGVALWLAFCVVAVMVRGVRWDETFEHAQAITRQVAYPEGHPLFRYVRGAFSLQTYTSALLLILGSSPAFLCGLRNVLFLAATVVPVFLFTTLLSRRAVWGHAAALLALEGIYLEFDGSYPIAVWPHLFSNGHIGGGYALLVLWAVLAGHSGWGFFLLGLMPCIHIGQMPVLLGVTLVYAVRMRQRGQGAEMARAARFAGLGLACCAVFYVLTRYFGVSPPTSGPYYAAGDPWPIWRGYTARHDVHRVFPPGNGHIALVGMLVLSAMAAYIEARRRDGAQQPGPNFWLFAYVLGTAAVVWSIMAVHGMIGPDMPFFLIAWMPYRLINHVPPLLLAIAVGVLAGALEDASGDRTLAPSGKVLLGGALAFCVLRPALRPLLGMTLFSRYVSAGDAVFFALYGAAFATLQIRRRADQAFIMCTSTIGLVALAGLACYHQFGAACVGIGWVLGVALWLRSVRKTEPASDLQRFRVSGGTLVCIAAGVALLAHEWRQGEHLPISTFDRRVVERLRGLDDKHGMLLAAPYEFMFQARTGHPVLVETATASLISYMPALGPVIQKIYREVYGIRFDTDAPAPVPWQEMWAARKLEEWQALARAYGFGYIAAPVTPALNLPVLFVEGAMALYQVPDA